MDDRGVQKPGKDLCQVTLRLRTRVGSFLASIVRMISFDLEDCQGKRYASRMTKIVYHLENEMDISKLHRYLGELSGLPPLFLCIARLNPLLRQ